MKGSYSTAQIGLHWLIALFLPIQYLTGGSIERTHHAAHMGVTPSSFDEIGRASCRERVYSNV